MLSVLPSADKTLSAELRIYATCHFCVKVIFEQALSSTGGSQFTATVVSVATSCDPPVWRAAILAAVGRAVLGEPRGEGRAPSHPLTGKAAFQAARFRRAPIENWQHWDWQHFPLHPPRRDLNCEAVAKMVGTAFHRRPRLAVERQPYQNAEVLQLINAPICISARRT